MGDDAAYESGAVCIPNIGPRERRRRMVSGVVGLGLGAVAAAALLAGGVARPVRLVVFLPLLVGAFGVFQAREKT